MYQFKIRIVTFSEFDFEFRILEKNILVIAPEGEGELSYINLPFLDGILLNALFCIILEANKSTHFCGVFREWFWKAPLLFIFFLKQQLLLFRSPFYENSKNMMIISTVTSVHHKSYLPLTIKRTSSVKVSVLDPLEDNIKKMLQIFGI